jgi:archaellum component FlaC
MLGGAGKKIQTMVELAEELYERVNELRERVESVSGTVEDTAERVERLEGELADQRAIVEALAEERGIDVSDAVAATETGVADGAPATEPPDETAGE